jgi:hypothetical protein
MTEENKPKSPFALALAARRKEVPEESLSGAARLLFKDTTLTQVALEGYAKSKPVVRDKPVVRQRSTFKRG